MGATRRLGAADRARWLAELAQAIDDAQRLAWRVGVIEGQSSEALELYVQLETARLEVESLRGAARAQSERLWPAEAMAEPVRPAPENP